MPVEESATTQDSEKMKGREIIKKPFSFDCDCELVHISPSIREYFSSATRGGNYGEANSNFMSASLIDIEHQGVFNPQSKFGVTLEKNPETVLEAFSENIGIVPDYTENEVRLYTSKPDIHSYSTSTDVLLHTQKNDSNEVVLQNPQRSGFLVNSDEEEDFINIVGYLAQRAKFENEPPIKVFDLRSYHWLGSQQIEKYTLAYKQKRESKSQEIEQKKAAEGKKQEIRKQAYLDNPEQLHAEIKTLLNDKKLIANLVALSCGTGRHFEKGLRRYLEMHNKNGGLQDVVAQVARGELNSNDLPQELQTSAQTIIKQTITPAYLDEIESIVKTLN